MWWAVAGAEAGPVPYRAVGEEDQRRIAAA
jgi:hypothetical protein